MQWIIEHLQFVVIGGLALAGFLKSRFDARNEQQGGEEPWTPFEPPERSPESPRPYVPPPVTRTATPPPLRPVPVAAAPSPRQYAPAVVPTLEDMSAELRHQQQIADRLRALQENRAADVLRAEPHHRRQSTTYEKAPPIAPSGLRKRLRTPAEIRAAIVLKEILDQPVGLR